MSTCKFSWTLTFLRIYFPSCANSFDMSMKYQHSFVFVCFYVHGWCVHRAKHRGPSNSQLSLAHSLKIYSFGREPQTCIYKIVIAYPSMSITVVPFRPRLQTHRLIQGKPSITLPECFSSTTGGQQTVVFYLWWLSSKIYVSVCGKEKKQLSFSSVE